MTNTDKTVSTERLALAEEIIKRWAQWIAHVSADMDEPEWPTASANSVANDRDFVLSVLSASRTQSPAEWQVEAAARIISPNCMWDAGYVNPHIEGRRNNARSKAAAALRAASIPTPERSKEEVGVKPDELVAAGREFLEAAEAVFDWMNGNDLSADHEEQRPDDFRRVSEALVAFRAALSKPGEQ